MGLFGFFQKKSVSAPQHPAKNAYKVSFYIKVYKEGKRWVCEEGDVYSDHTELARTKGYYATESEADYARLMQLH